LDASPEVPDQTVASIGPYRVTGVIGRGGMGTVYSAVRSDQSFEQEVAIKVLGHGSDNEAARSRFRQERQILARLEHPGIALLLDGGANEDGFPYLVMERVRGLPITDYARAKRLLLRQKLELFQQVCAAVHYAHQHLVVHRDIKPANILVTEEGVPKLLDFGIAKLLLEDSGNTLSGLRMLTPEYASPEQLLSQPVTTATDVYLLGVLLYELLAGSHPFSLDGQPPRDAERIVCEQDPVRPSSIAAQADAGKIRGELDNIVLMAMRKDPARRYGSVLQLSKDLQRHADGMPVLACPDTLAYRTSKFAKRHSLALATTVAVTVTLGAGAWVTTEQARRSEQRFQQVRRLANSFLFEFHDQIEPLPGSIEAREMVVRTALSYLNQLSTEASGDVSLERDIANAYQRVGDVQGNPYASNLGRSSDALASYQKAVEIKTRLLDRSQDPLRFIGLSESILRCGDVQLVLGQTREAQISFETALNILDRVPRASASEVRLLGTVYARLGQVKAVRGDAPGALDAYRTSAAHFRRLHQLEPVARNLDLLALSSQRSGYAMIWIGDVDGALAAYKEAIQSSEEALRLDPASTSSMRNLSLNYTSLGDLMGSPFHVNLGNRSEAIRYYRKALEVAGQMASLYPKDAQTRISVNQSRTRVAYMLRESEPQEALRLCQLALASNDSLRADDQTNTEYRRDRGFTLLGIGYMHEKLAQYDNALRYYRDALAVQESVALADSARTQFRQDMIPTHLFLGRLLRQTGQIPEARRHIEVALRLAEAQLGISPHNIYSIRNLSDCYEAMATVTDPGPWRTRNLDLWIAWEGGHRSNPYSAERRRRAEHP